MPVRFIAYTRVGMQRAGLLLAACIAADDRRSLDIDRIGTQLGRDVQRHVPVPAAMRPAAKDYLNSLRLWKRYSHLQGRDILDSDVLEIQDLWLADPSLPSATGALTPENANEIPQLATSLRLLRESSFTRTDRARALIVASGDSRIESLRSGEARPNPFELSAGAQLLLVAAFLEADGDFLQSLWRVAPPAADQRFTRPEFTSRLADACVDLHSRARSVVRTGADQQLLRRLAEWERAVRQERKSGSDWGGGRPPDQMATVRLEPFVDLGMITRSDRYAYRYRLTDAQAVFWQAVAEDDDITSLIRTRLVSAWIAANGRQAERARENEIWNAIRDSYLMLRSSLGFASFIEVVLVAVGRLLESDEPRWFELQDGIDVLVERRRASPRDVRLGINRGGELTYMKLNEHVKRA